MHISRVTIKNFRNFKHLEVETSSSPVLLGENGVGKTNFLEALRLVLDPSCERRLRKEDFHRGVAPFGGTEIEVNLQFADYTSDLKLFKLFTSCTIQDDPPVAQISYLYCPKIDREPETALGRDDYDYIIYGGLDRTNNIADVRHHLNLSVIPALRDIEKDTGVWRHSPLRRLVDLMNLPDDPDFISVVRQVSNATQMLQSIKAIQELQKQIKERLVDMIEGAYRIDPRLGILSSEPDELQRALKLFVDENLSLDRSSLGLANVLYLTLLMLEIEQKERFTGGSTDEDYQFTILAVEEPEAHLHPHLQRLVFHDFLRRHPPVLLSTHSPNIVSVAEPDALVILKDCGVEGAQATSTAGLARLPDWIPDWGSIKRDLARYLDATRGEIVFAKGVILVEGDAEVFLVPEFARRMKTAGEISCTLDGSGISMCNVSGTNFAPYVRFLGKSGLDLPIVVITDGDRYVGLDERIKDLEEDGGLDERVKQLARQMNDANEFDELRSLLETHGYGVYQGLKRGVELARLLDVGECLKLQALYDQREWKAVQAGLNQLGIFVNEWTLEAELISAGYCEEIVATYGELGASDRQQVNMRNQIVGGSVQGIGKAIDRIEERGKGRFAQRLADKVDSSRVPEYIRSAIKCIVHKVAPAPQASASVIVDQV